MTSGGSCLKLFRINCVYCIIGPAVIGLTFLSGYNFCSRYAYEIAEQTESVSGFLCPQTYVMFGIVDVRVLKLYRYDSRFNQISRLFRPPYS